MQTFNWLHLTDLHVGMRGQNHLWPNIKKSFFEDLARMLEQTGRIHAVFFTGDFVQRGEHEEFEKLDAVLGSIWERLRALGSNPILFPVPGNHDLVRPNVKVAAVRLLARWNDNPEIHEEFWTEPDSEYRKILDAAFSNYV